MVKPGFVNMIARIKKASILVAGLIAASCASYDGRGLPPGVATIDQVVALMGEPAMRWRDRDGSQQLAFPRDPAGVHTFMAFFGPDARLLRLENALEPAGFARILPGIHHQADILRLLGPSHAGWTAYFEARDELVWEWLFCDESSRLARFDVLFDASSGLVRSTYQRPDLRGPEGVAPLCSR